MGYKTISQNRFSGIGCRIWKSQNLIENRETIRSAGQRTRKLMKTSSVTGYIIWTPLNLRRRLIRNVPLNSRELIFCSMPTLTTLKTIVETTLLELLKSETKNGLKLRDGPMEDEQNEEQNSLYYVHNRNKLNAF